MNPTPPSFSVTQVYRRLLGYLRGNMGFFLASVVGFAIFAASQPMLAVVMEIMINVIEQKQTDQRVVVPLMFVGIYIVRGIGSFAGVYFISRVSNNVVYTMRVEMFNKLTTLPKRYFDENTTGHIMSRITYNVNNVTKSITDALTVLIREGLTIVALMGYLIWKDWQLTMIFVAIAPLIGWMVSKVGKRLRKTSFKVQESMGAVTHVLNEVLGNLSVVRDFGGKTVEQERFQKAANNNRRQQQKLVTTAALNTPLVQLVVAFAMGFLVFLALTFMSTDNPGAFVAYITAAALIPKPLRQLTKVNNIIQQGVAAAYSIFEVLDEPAQEDSGEHPVSNVRGDIGFKAVRFSYDDESLIDELSLDVAAGMTVALVGRSGSGKSTLVGLLSRQYELNGGEISIDSVPIQDIPLEQLRRNVSIVSQQVQLFNDTVANNIAYGDMVGASRDDIITAAKRANAWEFISDMPDGLDTLLGENGARLSGGQRQRIAIARALLRDTPILILDEATSALDTESELKIQQALDVAMKGRTTLVIAHRLSTIEKADHIVVMDSGSIVEQGDHTSLVASGGIYAALHARNFGESEMGESENAESGRGESDIGESGIVETDKHESDKGE